MKRPIKVIAISRFVKVRGLLGEGPEGKGKRVRPYGSESRLKRAKGQRLPQHSPAGV